MGDRPHENVDPSHADAAEPVGLPVMVLRSPHCALCTSTEGFDTWPADENVEGINNFCYLVDLRKARSTNMTLFLGD